MQVRSYFVCYLCVDWCIYFFKKKICLFFCFVCMGILPQRMSVFHIHAMPTEARRVLDPQEPEFQIVVNFYVRAKLTQVLSRAASILSH